MNHDDVYEDPRSRWFRRGVWAALAIAGVGSVLVYRARPSNQPRTPAELIRVVRDPAATSAARHVAAAALGKLEGAAASPVVPLLVEVLKTGDDQARFLAAMALEQLGTKALAAKPALIQATADLDPKVRQFAVRTLARMGPDDELVATFTAAARDPHADVRQEAFSALRLQQTGVAAALVTLLAADDAAVRRLAASELSRLPSDAAITAEPLHRALADDDDPLVRTEALKTLRSLSLLTTEELIAGFRDPGVREAAFMLFNRRQPGAVAAVPELRRFLKSDDHDLVRKAVLALASLGSAARAAVDDLLACADDDDEHVRIWVRLALGSIGLEGQFKPPDLWQQLDLAKDDVKSLILSDEHRRTLSPASRSPPSLGDQDMVHLAGLANLRYLNLSYTEVGDAGLAHLAGLTKLERLFLNNTRVTSAGLAHLAGLSNLRELRLDECQVTDDGIAHLETLERLERLCLTQTEITDAGLAYLAGLHDLKALLLSDTTITDAGMPHLAGLLKLKLLYLHGTQVTDAGLTHLNKLDQLSEFSFDRKRVTTQGLSQLRGLTELQLSDAPIGDADLIPLYGLKRLQRLDLARTRVTPAGAAKLKRELPDVQIYLY